VLGVLKRNYDEDLEVGEGVCNKGVHMCQTRKSDRQE
jgi:hypothetical protein